MLIKYFMHKVKNQQGIGLVEVLVGMAIMLLVISPIANVIKTSFRAYQFDMAQNHNVTGGRDALNIIADELRYATSMSNPPYQRGQYKTSTEVDYTVSVNSAEQDRRIYIVSENNNNTLVIEHNGTIYKKVAIGTVSSIQFQRDASNMKIITETIGLNDKSYQNSPNITFNTVVVMFNMIPQISSADGALYSTNLVWGNHFNVNGDITSSTDPTGIPGTGKRIKINSMSFPEYTPDMFSNFPAPPSNGQLGNGIYFVNGDWTSGKTDFYGDDTSGAIIYVNGTATISQQANFNSKIMIITKDDFICTQSNQPSFQNTVIVAGGDIKFGNSLSFNGSLIATGTVTVGNTPNNGTITIQQQTGLTDLFNKKINNTFSN